MAEASASFYTTFGNLTKAICVKAHIAGVRPLLFEFLRTFPMAIFQQNLPASVRFGPPAPQDIRGVPATDRRPYLITPAPRRNATPTRPTVASTSQYLALFPHESEDARLTGATRSLYRRLLALNLPRTAVRAESSTDSSEVRLVLVDTKIA